MEAGGAHVATNRPNVVNGVTLGELYPLLYDAGRLDVAAGSGRVSIAGDVFLEELFKAVLFEENVSDAGRGNDPRAGSSPTRWSLALTGRVIRDVRSISVTGTLLETRELSVWLSWEGIDRIEDEIQGFARRFDLTIDTTNVPNTESKLTTTERARGRTADVVLIQSDYIPNLRESGALQPIRRATRDDASAPAEQAFSAGGSLWAAPFYFDSHVVFYNPEIVPQRPQSDWTLSDLERIAGSLVGEVPVPLTWNAYSAYWLTPFALGFGKDRIVELDGRVHVNDGATRDALEYILSLMDRGILNVMERDAMTSYFTDGRAGFILSGSYSIPNFEALGIPFAVAPFPTVDVTGLPLRPFLDFKGFAVARRAHHPVLARRFISYMTSPAVQARITLPIRKMPADPAGWPLVVDEHPYAETLMQSYENGVPVPNQRGYNVYKSLMWRMLRFAFSGQMSVDQMLEESDRLLQAAAEEYSQK